MPQLPPLTPANGGLSINEKGIKPGDIIVTGGETVFSSAIQAVTQGPVSHVMVAVQDREVVEAVLEGVRRISLEQALIGSSLAIAFRRKGITTSSNQQVINNINSIVGGSYSHWAVIKRLFVGYRGQKREVPVDLNNLYCSQVVLTAFASAGYPLLASGDVGAWPSEVVQFDDFGGNLLDYVGHLLAN